MCEYCWKPALCFHLCVMMIQTVLSMMSFNMAGPTRLEGGKAYILWGFPLNNWNAIWIWHLTDVFVYLLIEMGSKEINLRSKLKLDTEIFKQSVAEHPSCVVTECPEYFVFRCVIYTRNVARRRKDEMWRDFAFL